MTIYRITDTVGEGRTITFTPDDMTPLLAWLDAQLPPGRPADVQAAADEFREAITAGHVEISDATLAYLGLTMTTVDEDTPHPAIPRHAFRRVELTREGAHELTRSPLERALTLSGERSHHVSLVRLAYIAQIFSADVAQATADEVNALGINPDEVDFWGDKRARRIINDAFTRAHAHARQVWRREHAAIMDGRRLPGQLISVMLTIMGISTDDLAAALRTTPATVRDWVSGARLISEDATTRLWEIWETHRTRAAEWATTCTTSDGDEVTILDPGAPWSAIVLAMAQAAAGQRVTMHPGPHTQRYSEPA
ncbi:MAG: hypothetical protein Q3999_05030 [Buchananella hordeovulneris]|nr:hypothetical protein [Buchananella hordeovulneris]